MQTVSPRLPLVDTSSLRHRRWLAALMTVAIAATTLCLRSSGYRHPSFIGSWSDDFFYYLRIASNWVAGNGLTFEGTMPTNGYQPLWQALVSALVFLFGADGVLSVMILAVALGTTACFLTAWRLVGQLIGSDGVISLFAALYTTVYFYMVAKHGMESILAVPLLMGFVTLILKSKVPGSRPPQLIGTGALVSLMVLTRIDFAIYIVLILPVWMMSRKGDLRGALRDAGLVAIGCAPLLVYGLFNYVNYGALLPVSGQAKQLASFQWSNLAIHGFEVSHRFHYFFIVPSAILNVLALAYVAVRPHAHSDTERIALLPALSFPPVFYLVQSAMSDWPLWDWYLYPWIATTPVAIGVLLRARTTWLALESSVDSFLSRAWAKPLVLVSGCLPVGLAALAWNTPRTESPILDFAVALRRFAETHPGRYAMGDRAGMVGFLLPHPLLQLEGLVGDRKFLDNIRQRRDLREVLGEHRIDYYVTSSATEKDGCYHAVEPYQGGPGSPKMSGTFCEEPVMVHRAEYDGTISLVFSLRPVDSSS